MADNERWKSVEIDERFEILTFQTKQLNFQFLNLRKLASVIAAAERASTQKQCQNKSIIDAFAIQHEAIIKFK